MSNTPTAVQDTAPKAPVKAPRKKTTPAKTSMNLYIKEKSALSPSRWLPAVLIIVILAALFGKFAVADRFARLREAESALAARQNELAQLQQTYADYDEVEEQYSQYTYRGFDRTIADRQEILDLLERDIIPYSQTRSVSVTGNVFSTTVTGLTLDQVSTMMAKLEADPLVDTVTVSTAGYEDEQTDGQPDTEAVQPYATITIVFINAEGGAE